MNSPWLTQKRAVVEAARRVAEAGLTSGASGNVSMRLGPDLLAITGSGKSLANLAEDDVAVVDFEVEPVEGDALPSTETLMHVAVYRARPDVGAVIHTHSVYASAAAVAGLAIPPIIDEMVVALGGAIQVSEYAFPGTQELADGVCAALGERNAALVRSHGGIGVGRDLAEALDVSMLTERVAKVFFCASLLGMVTELPEEVVQAETAIFRMRQKSKEDTDLA